MGTRFRGTKEEVNALDAYIKLTRATESVTARIHRHLADKGLTLSQLGVLEALYHIGPMPQRELGRKLLKSGGNVTMVVDNLETRSLVRRERDITDRRFVYVYLTDEGRKLIGEVFPGHVRQIVSEMGALTQAEQQELSKLCRKLGLKSESEDRKPQVADR